MASRLEEIRTQKINKLEQLKEHYDPFEFEKYKRDMSAEDFRKKYESLKDQEKKEEMVSLAGRIISVRGHGKLQFMDLKDQNGELQVVFRKDDIENFDIVKFISIGDIVGVKGHPMRTRAGELSVQVKEFLILSKNIMPLPEKWHGLQDPELKYRKRYVDFIMDDESRKAIIIRSQIIKEMRDILNKKGFLEIETPMLHSIVGGANAKPFMTHHNALDIPLNLRIAPELHLKRLIVGGFEKVYEIGRQFRNEGIDFKHNPEFTTMELYWAYADYEDVMDITEELLHEISNRVIGKEEIEYEGKTISLKRPWKRISMNDAVKAETGIDFSKLSNEEALELARKHNVELPYDGSRGKILVEFFDKYVEDKLIAPTFITKYPVEVSPLAKRDPKDKTVTNRFELFINGWEFANAFSELNDPFDQYERFKKQVELKDLGDEEANDMDYDFIEALETGLPPTGGLGIGIDRFAMLLSNKHSIRDVLAFPLLRPEISDLQKILDPDSIPKKESKKDKGKKKEGKKEEK